MFATLNVCVSGGNMSNCNFTCSATSELANAVLQRIGGSGKSYSLNEKTNVTVYLCDWTETPLCSFNHFGFLSRILGLSL